MEEIVLSASGGETEAQAVGPKCTLKVPRTRWFCISRFPGEKRLNEYKKDKQLNQPDAPFIAAVFGTCSVGLFRPTFESAFVEYVTQLFKMECDGID